MVELFEQHVRKFDRHSSKGNQLKWEDEGIWYKADYTGYEGLAEYVISRLLEFSSLEKEEYILYDIEKIKYRKQIFLGAKSKNMLEDGWQIITLERLFKNFYNESLHRSLWMIKDVKERLKFLCDQITRITGISSFGQYMAKLLTIDALFKNEDRHTHNIALLMNENGEYKLCPIFDNGAGLLSDTKLDYPMAEDTYMLLESVNAKTVSLDFDEQLDAAEELYGQSIKFYFDEKDVENILMGAKMYESKELERVKTILYYQMRKYAYLFQTKG